MTQYENLQDIDKMAGIIAEASNMGEYTQSFCYYYLHNDVNCFTCNKDCREGVKLWLKSEVEE